MAVLTLSAAAQAQATPRAAAPAPASLTEDPGKEPVERTDRPRRGTLAAVMERPTGIMEAGVGLLALPGARVCAERDTATCSRGDSSITIEAWQLFRLHPHWAAGAGITWGLIPMTDVPPKDPAGIERSHARSYFSVATTLRRYERITEEVEAWAGVFLGLAVLSDSFSNNADATSEKALVGSPGSTIRSEGALVGAGVGLSWAVSPHWLLGGGLRYESWFLPSTPNRNVFLDESSVAGHTAVIGLTLGASYWLSL